MDSASLGAESVLYLTVWEGPTCPPESPSHKEMQLFHLCMGSHLPALDFTNQVSQAEIKGLCSKIQLMLGTLPNQELNLEKP